jgi:phosphomannomutase
MLKFGTSGLRGLVTDMTDRECYINTRGYLTALLKTGEIKPVDSVSVAGDLRSSTDQIIRSVARAIMDAECKVDYCGKVPSPALAYQGFRNHRASVMVTGSHIPDDRNGIKFNKPAGEILKNDEAGILAAVAEIRAAEEEHASGGLFDAQGYFKAGQQPSLPPVNPEAEEYYIRRYLDAFTADFLKDKKIVFEQHSAVGRDIMAKILKVLGAELILEGRTDYFVPKDTENVTADTRDNFRRLAQKHKPFAIISTDGDSDRPFVVDENGVFIHGDKLGAVVANYLGARAAVIPINANDAVVTFLAQQKIPVAQTRIGSPYVIAAMNQAVAAGKKPVTGWESNGGFLTATEFTVCGKILQPLPTRDSLLPILCVLGEGIRKGSLSAVFDQMPQRFTQAGLLDNFPVEVSERMMAGLKPKDAQVIEVEFSPQGSAQVRLENGQTRECPHTPVTMTIEGFWKRPGNMWTVKEILEKHYFKSEFGYGTVMKVDVIDGVRIFFSNGDVAHIRPSGNAPQLRIYSNASTQIRADEIVVQGLDDKGILRMMERDICISK